MKRVLVFYDVGNAQITQTETNQFIRRINVFLKKINNLYYVKDLYAVGGFDLPDNATIRPVLNNKGFIVHNVEPKRVFCNKYRCSVIVCGGNKPLGPYEREKEVGDCDLLTLMLDYILHVSNGAKISC